MVLLVYGIILGGLAAGLLTLFVHCRSLGRQVDALRTEVAVARIERVLREPDIVAAVPPAPDVVHRKGHLGLVRASGLMGGAAVVVMTWLRAHRAAASMGAVATAALVTTGAVYLGGPDQRQSEPAPTWPAPSSAPRPALAPNDPEPSATQPQKRFTPSPPAVTPPPAPARSPSLTTDDVLTPVVSLLPAPVPSLSMRVSLTPMPGQELPCVRVTLGPADAEACPTG